MRLIKLKAKMNPRMLYLVSMKPYINNSYYDQREKIKNTF